MARGLTVDVLQEDLADEGDHSVPCGSVVAQRGSAEDEDGGAGGQALQGALGRLRHGALKGTLAHAVHNLHDKRWV